MRAGSILSGLLGLDEQIVLCAALRGRRCSVGVLRLEKGRMRLLSLEDHEAGAGEPEAAFLSRSLTETAARSQAAPDAAVWALSRKELLFKRFALPLAARENLDWVVASQIPNQLPLAADQIVFCYQPEESPAGKELNIALFALTRERMEALRLAAQAVGVPVARIVPFSALLASRSAGPERQVVLSVEASAMEAVLAEGSRLVDSSLGPASRAESMLRTWQDLPGGICTLDGNLSGLPESLEIKQALSPVEDVEGFSATHARQALAVMAGREYLRQIPSAFDLLPKEHRPASRFGPVHRMRLMAAALALSLVLLGGAGLFRHWNWNRAARLEMAALADEYARVDDWRKRRQAALDNLEALADAWPDRPARIEWLARLSSLLPADTWLGRISFTGDKVDMEGFSESAQQMIPLLETSGLLQKVAFSGAITKTQGERPLEVFRLTGDLPLGHQAKESQP